MPGPANLIMVHGWLQVVRKLVDERSGELLNTEVREGEKNIKDN